MMAVTVLPNAPKIGFKIKEIIESITDINNYVLSLQFDYRDHNTLFYFDKVTDITFSKELLSIKQKNNSTAFFNYRNILEYCVINASDVLDLEI